MTVVGSERFEPDRPRSALSTGRGRVGIRGGPPGVSVTSQAVEQMSGDVLYLDELLRVSENRAGVLQCSQSAHGYWMTNGDVQVIVALLGCNG